jgi:hypothetical protein
VGMARISFSKQDFSGRPGGRVSERIGAGTGCLHLVQGISLIFP